MASDLQVSSLSMEREELQMSLHSLGQSLGRYLLDPFVAEPPIRTPHGKRVATVKLCSGLGLLAQSLDFEFAIRTPEPSGLPYVPLLIYKTTGHKAVPLLIYETTGDKAAPLLIYKTTGHKAAPFRIYETTGHKAAPLLIYETTGHKAAPLLIYRRPQNTSPPFGSLVRLLIVMTLLQIGEPMTVCCVTL